MDTGNKQQQLIVDQRSMLVESALEAGKLRDEIRDSKAERHRLMDAIARHITTLKAMGQSAAAENFAASIRAAAREEA